MSATASAKRAAKSPSAKNEFSLTNKEWLIFNELKEEVIVDHMFDQMAIGRLSQREKEILEIGLILKYGITY